MTPITLKNLRLSMALNFVVLWRLLYDNNHKVKVQIVPVLQSRFPICYEIAVKLHPPIILLEHWKMD